MLLCGWYGWHIFEAIRTFLQCELVGGISLAVAGKECVFCEHLWVDEWHVQNNIYLPIITILKAQKVDRQYKGYFYDIFCDNSWGAKLAEITNPFISRAQISCIISEKKNRGLLWQTWHSCQFIGLSSSNCPTIPISCTGSRTLLWSSNQNLDLFVLILVIPHLSILVHCGVIHEGQNNDNYKIKRQSLTTSAKGQIKIKRKQKYFHE